MSNSPTNYTQPREVYFMGGCHIDEAARMLVRAAREHGYVYGNFNEITLQADRASTAEVIIEYFYGELKRRDDAYRNSPQGKAAAAKNAAEIAETQQRYDAMVASLSSLNFNNDEAVLNWICEAQEPSDRVGIDQRRAIVLKAFADHGWYPAVNCGETFNGDDRDNFVRWIVGQALDGLRTVAIHSLVHKFADQWRAKFIAHT